VGWGGFGASSGFGKSTDVAQFTTGIHSVGSLYIGGSIVDSTNLATLGTLWTNGIAYFGDVVNCSTKVVILDSIRIGKISHLIGDVTMDGNSTVTGTSYIGAGLGTITDPSNVMLFTETALQFVGNGSCTGTWWNNGAAYFGDAVVCSSTVNLLGGVTITGLLTADSLASNGKTRVGRELTVGGWIEGDSIGTADDSLWIWSDDVIRFRDYSGYGAWRDGKTIHRYIYSDTFAVNGGTRIEVISPMDMNLNNLYFNGTDSAKIFNGGTNLDFSIKGTGWTIPLRIIPDTVQIWIAQFGGGYGTTGCDIQADGDIFTDGNVKADTFKGHLTGSADSLGGVAASSYATKANTHDTLYAHINQDLNTTNLVTFAGVDVNNSSYRGTTANIDTDDFTSFTPTEDIGVIMVYARNNSYKQWNIMVNYRTVATHFTVKMFGYANFDVTTGALNGTTGTDGHCTISADSADGKIYIENRSGGTVSFGWILFGS
jgi:hypothetical protein